MGTALRLRLFKLRFADGHCFIAVSHDDDGDEVDVPGVDLEGPEAREAFRLAGPLLDEIGELGEGAATRSLSINLERQRLLATLEASTAAERPTVIRIDAGPEFDRVLLAAAEVHAYLKQRAGERLARRSALRSTQD